MLHGLAVERDHGSVSTAGEPLVLRLVWGFLWKGGGHPGPRAAGDATGYGVDPVAEDGSREGKEIRKKEKKKGGTYILEGE